MPKGDINNDGLISKKDYEMLQKAAAGILMLKKEEFMAADMNDDGKISLDDVMELEKILALRISGDATGDGKLTQDDVKAISNVISGKLHLADRLFYNADINRDATIDKDDLELLRQLLKGVIVDAYGQNKVTISLEPFKKGEYLSWFVSTQASAEMTITLKDDTKEYFSAHKPVSGAGFQALECGNEPCAGNKLVLEIDVPKATIIRPIPAVSEIVTNTGKIIGHTFTCCGEDAVDDDYNDFCITITGWKVTNK